MIIACTRNAAGRLCSSLSYALPSSCLSLYYSSTCISQCRADLRQRVYIYSWPIVAPCINFIIALTMQYGCCSRSHSSSYSYYSSSSIRRAASTCGIESCPLPNSDRINTYTITTMMLALLCAIGALALALWYRTDRTVQCHVWHDHEQVIVCVCMCGD